MLGMSRCWHRWWAADHYCRARLSRRRSERSKTTSLGSSQMICRRMGLMDLWVRVSRTISILLFVSNTTALLREAGKPAMLSLMATVLTHSSRRQLLRRMEQYWHSNAASTQRWRCEWCILQSHLHESAKSVALKRSGCVLSPDYKKAEEFPFIDGSYSHEDSIRWQ